MDITREACEICKSYDFYDIPHDDVENHDDTTNDDLVYRINVTLHKEGVIVTTTACFFVSVIIGVCFKLCKQRRKTTIRTRWVLEMFFSIINIAWIAACVVLLSKCSWMLFYQYNDLREIVKLFPWYVCTILSCCIIDISESCTYRLLNMTNAKMLLVDPDDVTDKKLLKTLYQKGGYVLPGQEGCVDESKPIPKKVDVKDRHKLNLV